MGPVLVELRAGALPHTVVASVWAPSARTATVVTPTLASCSETL